MLADYRAAQARIDASTDRLFDVKPRANYEIRPVEPFRERSFSGGSYTAASLDGTPARRVSPQHVRSAQPRRATGWSRC